MGDRKRQRLILGLLGLASAAVLMRTAALVVPGHRETEQTGCFRMAPSTPPIQTTVGEVEVGRFTVVLRAGIELGIELGDEFTVYRGDHFVGKVRVSSVTDRTARAQILFTRDGQAIRPGDNAATQI